MENAEMTLGDAQCHLDGLLRGHRLARLRSRAHSANQSVIAAFAFKAIQRLSTLDVVSGGGGSPVAFPSRV
jgi:hypothetical protein